MNNITLFQFFHWYYRTEDHLWIHAAEQAPRLAQSGVTHVWLPPAYKSANGLNEPGYAVYDLYDLGEFFQKETVGTKHGTKPEYLMCIHSLHENGIQVLADIVLNHKHGGDEKERVPVQEVNPDNRNENVGGPTEVDAWTKFTFPGRKGKYSDFVWDWHSFTGLSENEKIFMILNEHADGKWEPMLEDENGNFDYLMGNDIEFRNPYVREELRKWGEWYVETAGLDGFRLDALKHINYNFFNEWLDYLKTKFNKDFFTIGEYWRSNLEPLLKYIEVTGGRIQLFDAPLHFNFHEASLKGNEYDLRTIFHNSLLSARPELSITFVDNHDTQPLQSLQSPVEPWFKPLAYALILLREQGIPCIFYPTIYGAKYWDRVDNGDVLIDLPAITCVETMMRTRKNLAFGAQRDYLDHPNTIGWTREGDDKKKNSGCAVLLTNGTAGEKEMEMGDRHKGKVFIDICGGRKERVTIDENGRGRFFVGDMSASVWIREEAVA
jgi:alpha-amylase